MSKKKTTAKPKAAVLDFVADVTVPTPPPEVPVTQDDSLRLQSAKVHRAEILKLMRSMAHRHDYRTLFADFVECAALAISNAVDVHQKEAREKRYLEVVKRYKAEEVALFPKMLGQLVLALEAEPHDALGAIYGELEISNKHVGQFFTPYALCRMMGRMMIDDQMRATIAANGYITVQEPACGAGATIIGLAHEMLEAGINYQNKMHVTAIDVDLKCVHMCYVQFALLHIPAVIVHGNTLSLEEWAHWKTPAHIMGGWWYRLKRRTDDRQESSEPTEEAA